MAEEKNEIIAENEEERYARYQAEREKRKKRNQRKSIIVSVIMTFALVIEITAVGTYMGFFSAGSAKKLGEYLNSYSDEAYEVVLQRLEAWTIKNGLPTSVYEDVITQERVNITLEAFANDLSEMDFESDVVTDDISKAIDENVRLHLTSTGVKVDKNVNENINYYVGQCINIYQKTLVFSHFRIIRQLKMYLFYFVVAVTVVCATVIAVCLILLNRYVSRNRQILRFFIYALGASWILTLVPSFLIYHRILPIYISGMNLEFQFNLVMSYFYTSLRYLMTISNLIFVAYITLIGVWYYIANKKRTHI
ncbi:MAG: hypothetical protein IJU39_07120 [Clostridia bacterium]|nr:hypothetical protein [Clostridia bacterium]